MDDRKEAQEEREITSTLEWFQFIQDFADKLTLKRIVTVFVTGFLATLVVMLYENRDVVFQKAYNLMSTPAAPPTSWVTSQKSKDDLTALVDKSKLIKLATLYEIDLQKNRRMSKFLYLKDQDSNLIQQRVIAMLPQTVFDYDGKNTAQMVAVLNNEFVCSKFSETFYQRAFPELAKRIPTICRIAVPPFYGKFVGILTIGLAVQPTKDELDSIRLEASRIAVEVYLRDVLKKSIPENK